MSIYIIPTFDTQMATQITNETLTELAMYDEAREKDEPISVPSLRTRGELLSRAQSTYIDVCYWIDSPFLSADLSQKDMSVLIQITKVLKDYLLTGKITLEPVS